MTKEQLSRGNEINARISILREELKSFSNVEEIRFHANTHGYFTWGLDITRDNEAKDIVKMMVSNREKELQQLYKEFESL